MKTFSLLMAAASPSMTARERAHVVQLLHRSQHEYLAYIEDINEAQWNWKAALDRWSVGQTAEHIVLAEVALFAAVQRAIQNSADVGWEAATAGKTELLERAIVDRSHKALSPERLTPQGLSRAQAIHRFKEVRANTIRFADETQIPLKQHTAEHPFPIFKTLNAYQWLLYIPLHNLRHNQQIAEIKATPGYPR